MLPLTQWAAFRSRLIWAYDRVLENPAGRMVAPYLGAPVTAWRIRSGEVTLQFGEKMEHYGPGAWIFPRAEPGMQQLSERLSLISIRFEAHWVYGAPVLDRSRSVELPLEEVPALTQAAEALVEAVRGGGNGGGLPQEMTFPAYLGLLPKFAQWLEVYHRTLIAHGVRSHELETLDERVRLALCLLDSQPLSVPMREAELARQVGWSRSHLNRQFFRQTGRTPAALWNQRRLEAAQTELLHGSQSMKEIAYLLGFTAPEHFTRWFARQNGCAPGVFRRRFAGEAGL